MSTEKYKGMVLEIHRLQSFGVSCLNRDDFGTPKICIVGGTVRSRISSQCLKRAVRMKMHENGVETAVRTRRLAELVEAACKAPVDEAKREYIARLVAGLTANEAKSDGKDKKAALVFLVPAEVEALASHVDSLDDVLPEAVGKKAEVILKELRNTSHISDVSGLDLALFGRMMANSPDLGVQASVHTAHAYTTHETVVQDDYFSAVDDFESGSQAAHMDNNRFTGGTFYIYSAVALGVLEDNLSGAEDVPAAVDEYLKALYMAVPAGRQATFASSSPWNYARIVLRRGQMIQPVFDMPIKAEEDGGILAPSIRELDRLIDREKKLSGSLYGGIADFRFGTNEGYSIDDLRTDIRKELERLRGEGE